MQELQSLLKDLYLISGLNISIFDIDEHLVTSYPVHDSPFCALMKSHPASKLKCKQCDHKAFERVKQSGEIAIYHCDFHLYEAVVPLYTYGTHTGYLMMGQTLTPSQFEKERIRAAASPYVKDKQALNEAIKKISYHTKEQILAFASIINIYGQYLTLTNRIEAKNKNLAMEVKKYIQVNYPKEITIEHLCQYFYCSRGTLINQFKHEYGKTVHQYILEFRLEKALELLKNKHLTIQEIALNCGFSDANYFSKSFKKKYALSPTSYRDQMITSSKKTR